MLDLDGKVQPVDTSAFKGLIKTVVEVHLGELVLDIHPLINTIPTALQLYPQVLLRFGSGSPLSVPVGRRGTHRAEPMHFIHLSVINLSFLSHPVSFSMVNIQTHTQTDNILTSLYKQLS